MAYPRLPQISPDEEARLYAKLNQYNLGRASYRQAGAYLIVLPFEKHACYSLWVFDPELPRRTILFIHDLSADIYETFRMAGTMLYHAERMLLVTEYHARQMQTRGDDLIPFGKYHGHYLYEILKIDPAYLAWIAFRFTPRIPKQERFVKIAQAYHKVHLDLMKRHSLRQTPESYLGPEGTTVHNLTLRVTHVRLEDDPYKTRLIGTLPQFYVRQVLTLTDPAGHRIVIRLNSRIPSIHSATLPACEHAYRPGELLQLSSARILRCYTLQGRKYTRLGHIRLA